MKINELKRIAEENDYELTEDGIHYKLTHKYCDNYIAINYSCKNQLWISIPCFSDEGDFDMIKAAVEFAETPLEDREEEKKFYLRHRWLGNGRESNYLNFEISGLYYSLNTKCKANWAKNKFTNKDIEEIKKKFDTDLKDFELVEVKE